MHDRLKPDTRLRITVKLRGQTGGLRVAREIANNLNKPVILVDELGNEINIHPAEPATIH